MVFVPGTFLAEYRVARNFPITSSDGWWVNRWPLLGWLETVVKLFAFAVAAHVPLRNPAPYSPPRSPLDRASFYCETVLMFGAAVLLSLAIFDRLLLYREVISMVFVFPNMWAHWNIFFAMYRCGRDGISVGHFRIFCLLMLAGDVVKLVFFAVHDFSMLNVARYVCPMPRSCAAALLPCCDLPRSRCPDSVAACAPPPLELFSSLNRYYICLSSAFLSSTS
jgi:hypothetical protein